MKSKLLSNFKANKFFNMHQTHFGFDMTAASAANLKRERGFLLDSKTVIESRTIKDGGSPWTEFPNSLTEAEKIIFDRIIQNITLKHATNAGKEIQEAGSMSSLRTREQQGKTVGNRHTTTAQGQDESIYFVTGLGKHSPPSFVENSDHLVTIQLAALMKENPAVTSRLWLSNHWTEYQQGTPLKLVVGNAQINIQYAEKDQKQYIISYADGSLIKWSAPYKEELFVQQDVLPGVAFSFISLLRLLNAKPNPLITKLYALAETQDPEFDKVLEQLFNNLMPGNQRLEAKIIGQFDINSPFVSLEKQTHKSHVRSDKDDILRHAIKLNDFDLFSGLFKHVKDKSHLNLYSLAEAVLDRVTSTEEQKRYFTLLIEAGFAADHSSESDRFLELVIKKDDPELLDFFLGYPVPNHDVSELKRVLHPNPYSRSFGMNFNLVETACSECANVKIFEVLEKYGVDFQKYLPVYIGAALNKSKGINYAAIGFLGNKGDLTLRDTECNNMTPLMRAASLENLALTRFFIEKLHADVNEPYKMYHRSLLAGRSFSESSENGQTALHLAAKSGNEDIIRYLLSKGANPWLATVTGERPIDWATTPEITVLLQEGMARFPNKEEDASSANHKKQVDSHLSHHTKVVVMLTGVNRHGQRYVVLGKRRPGRYAEENSNDYLCFPGGNVDGSDASYEMAALRELKEETSVDVNAIAATGAAVSIKEIGHFDVDVSYEHKATKFFMVDVGNYPINIHPSDDLVMAQKVPLNTITRDDSNPRASYLSTQGTKILGSNALLLDNLLIGKSDSLTPMQQENINDQLEIEYQGYKLLTNLLSESKSMKPDTPEWKQLNYLLKNGAHLMGERLGVRSTLALQMATLNSKEGLSLLHEYGVECEYPGELNDKYETPLALCARTNNVELAKHLVSLGASPSYHHNRKFLFKAALENGALDMYYYLLSIGVTPNQYEPESRMGSLIVPSLLCDLVEKDKLDLLQRLLSEKTVLMSMDLTPDGKKNPLITAIRHGKKTAAKMLLATMRCPILQKDEKDGYREEAKNALDYLQKRPELSDIKDICQFLLKYADMNDFLREAFSTGCIMDEFLPSLDEKGKPTIHFIGSREHLSKIVDRIRPYSSTIREDANGRCYIRMGIKRLGALVNNEKIAEFLLNEAKESVFWPGHTSLVAEQLYKPALLGTLTNLSNQNLESWGLFANPGTLDFYRVLIQECLSLTNVKIHFADRNNTSALFLAGAIANHPCIRRLDLSLDTVTNENLEQLSTLIAKLPALEEIHLSAKNMQPDDFIRTMLAITQVKDRSLNITVDGINGSITPITEALKAAKFHHYINLIEDPHGFNDVLAEANFAAQEQFFIEYQGEEGERNNRIIQQIKGSKTFLIDSSSSVSLNNMLFQACHTLNPTRVKFSIDKEYCDKLDQRALHKLLENGEIKQIEVSSHTKILPSLVNSTCLNNLKRFDLRFVKIKTAEDLSQLTQIVSHAKQLQTLNLTYVTIQVDSPKEFDEFCDAISQHPHLETIVLEITFASTEQEQQFWGALAKSRSLLGFSNSTFKSVPYEKDLAETCKKNMEQQKEWAQSVKRASQQSIFSPSKVQRRIVSTNDMEIDTVDADTDTPVAWV